MNVDTLAECYIKYGTYHNSGQITFQFANHDAAVEARQWLIGKGFFAAVSDNSLSLDTRSAQRLLQTIDEASRSKRRQKVLERDSYQCQHCGFAADDGRPLEAAHIVASADGGADHPDNLQTLCVGCHSDLDGWEISDFRGARRVQRVVNYVSEAEELDGNSLVNRTAELLGVDRDECRRLMDERLSADVCDA